MKSLGQHTSSHSTLTQVIFELFNFIQDSQKQRERNPLLETFS